MSTSKSGSVLLVAVDNGHYGIKVYSGLHGSQGYIESRCRIGGSTSTELVSGSKPVGGERELVLVTEGQEYTTGSIQAMPTTFTDYPTSPINRVLVHSALHQSGFSGTSVELLLGLPFSQFYDSSTESGHNEKLIGGMEENVISPVSLTNSEPINIQKCSTLPEGMAAWFSYIMSEAENDKGKVVVDFHKERAEETVVLIDIGGQTTEVVTVIGRAAQKNYSASFPLGSHRIMEELRRYITEQSRVQNISDSRVKQALINGKITISGNQIDCNNIIKNASEKLVHQIKAQVDTLTNDIEGDIDKRLFLGGTALTLKDSLLGWKNAEMLDNPLYANAIGSYLYAKYLR
jgi:plasmid segregation protein ParM